MLKVLIPTFSILPVIWLSPGKWVWSWSFSQGFVLAGVSLMWLNWSSEVGWTSAGYYLATDPLSTPLLVLSCWLLPLIVMASQGHMSAEPYTRQRVYISLIVLLQGFLVLAFGATEVIMFYVMFEATLIPTLFIITR